MRGLKTFEADVTETVELRPGLTPLSDWRAIYRGASITLDPVARADVEAGRAALSDILSKNSSALPDSTAASPSVAELVERRGEPLPAGLLRLFVALKLASLAQGMSGVRWSVIEAIAEFLDQGLLPVVAADNADDRIALARLFGALTGTGEALRRGRVRAAQKALKKRDLTPLKLEPHERAALLSGTQLSLAAALAGLFEAERVLQSAIVATALSSAKHTGGALHRGAHRLHRQRGQIEVAAAFRNLLGQDAAQTAPTSGDTAGDPIHLRPIRLGACLDLLRYAGATLEQATRGVSEERLVLWQSEEIVAGSADLSSVALASDLIAQALRTIGDLSEARIAAAGEAAAANENTTGLGARAAAFVAENRERAQQIGLDPAGVWRLLPMGGTTALVVAIEFLEAARAADIAGDEKPRLNAVLKKVREIAQPGDDTGFAAATNLASIGALVGSGALAAASGVELPGLVPPQSERQPTRLGARAKGS